MDSKSGLRKQKALLEMGQKNDQTHKQTWNAR